MAGSRDTVTPKRLRYGDHQAGNNTGDVIGRVIVAHPVDVAAADQAAAARGQDVKVCLTDAIPSGKLYVLDFQALHNELRDEVSRKLGSITDEAEKRRIEFRS